MKKISFIGTGVMGASMARNLLKNGYEVTVYNRSKEKALPLLEDGAQVSDTIIECISDADIIISIVGLPSDVQSVGTLVIQNAKKNAIYIDMTTSSPTLAQELYQLGSKHEIKVLDAPVSGGDIGAKNATLSIMVGGDKEVFDAAQPIFECMGNNIIFCGNSGMGQHTKMANQIAIAGTIAGVSEAIAYANKTGLDAQVMLNAISAGAAGSWQMSNNAPKMIVHDYAPGFFIKHFVKDMNIALDCSFSSNLDLPVLKLVRDMYQELIEQGDENEGTQALIKRYK